MPEPDFSLIQPHEEAARLIEGKSVVAQEVFKGLLPELRGRAFTVSGIEGANVMQRVRDAIAALPRGGEEGTWDKVRRQVSDELEPYLGEGAGSRATVLIRTHGFQAFQAANWRVAQEDEDTTHLQYLATEDDRVRDTHLALNGLVLPKEDPFWGKHYPPWEWNCRCRVRAMNPDLVDEEKEKDEERNPEDRNVLEGPALKQLENGTLIRNGQRYDVSAPSDGPEGKDAFQWNPDDLRLPLGELKLRYDSDVWEAFESWARNNLVKPGTTVWNWLSNGPKSKVQGPRTKSDVARMDRRASAAQAHLKRERDRIGETGDAESLGLGQFRASDLLGGLPKRAAEAQAQARLGNEFTVQSTAGTEVKFARIVRGHFLDKKDERLRFLPSAIQTVISPVEVWQDGLRRRYIGRFVGRDKKVYGFVVVTGRRGEALDEVVTFFPKSGRALEKLRKGELIYRK